MSATEQYVSGHFDNTLKDVLQNYDEILNIILPTLGEARRETYSPFLPICEETGDGQGSKAVLEVRGYDVPFILEHNQIVGRLMYEKLTEFPEKFYGSSIGSNYQKQNLRLSKHFIQS